MMSPVVWNLLFVTKCEVLVIVKTETQFLVNTRHEKLTDCSGQ